MGIRFKTNIRICCLFIVVHVILFLLVFISFVIVLPPFSYLYLDSLLILIMFIVFFCVFFFSFFWFWFIFCSSSFTIHMLSLTFVFRSMSSYVNLNIVLYVSIVSWGLCALCCIFLPVIFMPFHCLWPHWVFFCLSSLFYTIFIFSLNFAFL